MYYDSQPKQDPLEVKSKQRSKTLLSSPLFEQLRALRRRLAEEESKPSFLIFSDATLQDMIRVKPKSLEQMLTVSGVGQHKLSHYGAYFLEVLQNDTPEPLELIE